MLNSKTANIWMIILLLSPIKKLVRNTANKLLCLRKHFIMLYVQGTFKHERSQVKGIVYKNFISSDNILKPCIISLLSGSCSSSRYPEYSCKKYMHKEHFYNLKDVPIYKGISCVKFYHNNPPSNIVLVIQYILCHSIFYNMAQPRVTDHQGFFRDRFKSWLLTLLFLKASFIPCYTFCFWEIPSLLHLSVTYLEVIRSYRL